MKIRWISFSTLIHIGVASFFYWVKPKQPEESIEISPISETTDYQRIQIIQVDSKLNKRVPKLGRLAKQSQQTDKETIASKTDKFINGSGEFGSAPKSITQKGPYKPEGKGKGVSATDDFIQGVEIGPMTIINSQEFKYFSYYERIKEKVVENWRPLIRKAIKKVKDAPKTYGELTIGYKTTKLEITLNSKGDILKIEIKESSGIPAFDKSGEQAFRKAAPFSQPPKELIKDEIFIIRWDFIVQIKPAGLIQFNTGNIQ